MIADRRSADRNVITRFAWAPLLVAFVLCGVTDVPTMIAVMIGAIILGAAAMRERMAGRQF